MRAKLIIFSLFFLISPMRIASQTQLWVGEKYSCFIEDYGNKAYDWVNVSWEIDRGLYENYDGDYVKTISFNKYTSGTKCVIAKWTETDLNDSFDPWHHKSHTWEFVCKDNPLVLRENRITLSKGNTYRIAYDFLYDNDYTNNAEITFSSSDASVVNISKSGVITAQKEGTTTITVYSSISKDSQTCDVIVENSSVNVTSITLSPSSASLTVGDTQQLTATISPSNATNKDVTWSSSNTDVATVNSSGFVTANSVGSATITCKANDGSGVTATCEVTTEMGNGSLFTGKTEEGIEMTFKVISAKDKTCQVGCDDRDIDYMQGSAIPKTTSGTVTIPYSVDGYNVIGIGGNAFYECKEIEKIILPTSITYIGNHAFGYSTITSLEIPNNITWIGSSFYNCRQLYSITIPRSVEYIDYSAFNGCDALSSIMVENGNKIYDSRNNCNAIIETKNNKLISGCKNTTFPSDVETIGKFAFSGIKLTNLNIPSSIKTIERGAFGDCNKLETVIFSGSIQTIEDRAFFGCKNLASITIYRVEPFEINDNVFSKSLSTIDIENGIYANAILYIPYGTRSKYLMTKGWKNFKNIVEMEQEGVPIDETNFPDIRFRYYLQAQEYGEDGFLTENEIEAITSIDVSKFDPTELGVDDDDRRKISSLKGIEYFTALTSLNCRNNIITSLDLSKNTKLTELNCNQNRLSALDLSKNTTLTSLSCGINQLTSLDVSKNTALTDLSCYRNQLTSLDLSKNTALTNLSCYNNQLTSLDVSNNTALTDLYFYHNNIKGAAMDDLISSLAQNNSSKKHRFMVVNPNDDNEGNVCTTTQVAAVNAKGWFPCTKGYEEYKGSEDSSKGTEAEPFTPAEANEFGSSLAKNEQSDQDYYIRGMVSSIKEQFGTQYGNATFYISADGTEKDQFYIYRALYLDNTRYAGQDLNIRVGDDVVVCGKITNYLGTLPETVQNKAYVVSINGQTTGIKDVFLFSATR